MGGNRETIAQLRRILWTQPASRDFYTIAAHLTRENPHAARKVLEAIYSRISSLSSLPYRARPGARTATRELVIPDLPYIPVYRITEHTVEILRIYHHAQDWL